jgi:hypothetical protein
MVAAALAALAAAALAVEQEQQQEGEKVEGRGTLARAPCQWLGLASQAGRQRTASVGARRQSAAIGAEPSVLMAQGRGGTLGAAVLVLAASAPAVPPHPLRPAAAQAGPATSTSGAAVTASAAAGSASA